VKETQQEFTPTSPTLSVLYTKGVLRMILNQYDGLVSCVKEINQEDQQNLTTKNFTSTSPTLYVL